MRQRLQGRWTVICLLAIGSSLLLMPAQSHVRAADTLHKQARAHEAAGRWYEACIAYDEILQKDRNQAKVRESFRRCLRHYRQIRRHHDAALQEQAEVLTPSEALALHEQVLRTIGAYYVDEALTDAGRLYREGIHELRFALRNEEFVKRHLNRARARDLARFKDKVEQWAQATVRTPYEVSRQVEAIILESLSVRLRPGVVVLELACGACHSLDDYSLFVSPSRLARAQSNDKQFGIGIELRIQKQSLVIDRVYQKSPAADAGLRRGDRLVRIDGQWLDPLDPESALDQLLGEADTQVELEIIPRGARQSRIVKTSRRPFILSSVEHRVLSRQGKYVGYLRIFDFQETTVQELKTALLDVQTRPLEGLILDLRSNPGGLVRSGIGVAEMFLPQGVIAHVVGRHDALNRTFRASNENPVLISMVVLVDHETASAAEIVVGALKDHDRATILGQTTFGKCSIQVPIPLKPAPGGLRLTVAKFTSPLNHSFSEAGIEPDLIIDDPRESAVLKAALREVLSDHFPMMK